MWNAALPADDSLLINTPGYLRANWDAIALGTDAALLITNEKIAAGAAIVDSKLATITTAGKVSGTALTLLPNIPAGAGVIPAANLPVGTTANKILQLDASAKIPAVDASQVTDIPAHSTNKLTSGTLPVTRGGTGSTAAANAASGVTILDTNARVPTANLGSGTAGATNYLRGDQSWQVITEANTSNVVFGWYGKDGTALDCFPTADGPGETKYTSTAYNYVKTVNGQTYVTILMGKFKKIAGISTVTIYARLATRGAPEAVYLLVDIGGQSNTVTHNTYAYTWATSSDINVSSLTNNTTYDITIQLKGGVDAQAVCSAVVLIAS